MFSHFCAFASELTVTSRSQGHSFRQMDAPLGWEKEKGIIWSAVKGNEQ